MLPATSSYMNSYTGNECEQGTHNCSRNEDCFDEKRGYRCECKAGFERDTVIGLCHGMSLQ